MQILRGIAVSPGVAIGPARVLDPRGINLPPRAISAASIPSEISRLDAALTAAERDAENAQADAQERLGPEYAAILGAHARMIADPLLRRDACGRIEREQISAEHAVTEVLDGLAARLQSLKDSHLAARAADVRDIERRILTHLLGGRPGEAVADAVLGIILAHDLTPSETARLEPSRALGFATEAGGRSSHTAIVAAALEIPAVVGLGPFLETARNVSVVIIDGDEGLVILDPDDSTLKSYEAASRRRAARFAALARLTAVPSETSDGVPVELLGNIEFPLEVELCNERGADGIGLFRTEFLYLNVERPPSEDEQFEAYATVVRAMEGKPVTIRTLDLGAEKLVSFQTPVSAEPNPNLGLRSIRLSLRDPSLFRTQLRAILRVATLGDVRIMFPLVSTLGELRRVRALLNDVARELASEGLATRATLPVGAMIEVPAAALMADQIAKEVDFFSIGTNDLVQYTLAVDRANETVAELYNAADPAVLRLIHRVVEAARPRALPVNICGTMGGDPLYTPLLLGLGLRQLSMPPHQFWEVKQVLRAVRLSDAEALAQLVLQHDTAEAVEARLRQTLARLLLEAEAAQQAPRRPRRPRRPSPRTTDPGGAPRSF
jgi:phosphotransferase system enzyme I (PtsI)